MHAPANPAALPRCLGEQVDGEERTVGGVASAQDGRDPLQGVGVKTGIPQRQAGTVRELELHPHRVSRGGERDRRAIADLELVVGAERCAQRAERAAGDFQPVANDPVCVGCEEDPHGAGGLL